MFAYILAIVALAEFQVSPSPPPPKLLNVFPFLLCFALQTSVGSFYSLVFQTFLANGFVIQHLRREMYLDTAFMISTTVIVLIYDRVQV